VPGAALSVLVEVEALTYAAARALEVPPNGAQPMPCCPLLSGEEAEVGVLIELVGGYRSVLARVRSSAHETAGLSQAVLASRGVLVTWAEFCVIHHAALRSHPQLRAFSVSVDWHDMEHLVLEDIASAATMLHVCEYLRAARGAKRPVVFSGRAGEHGGTDALADVVSAADQELRRLWADERTRAAQREAGRYEQVRLKQIEAARLRASLTAERVTLAQREADLELAQNAYYTAPSRRNRVERQARDSAQARVNSQRSVVWQLESSLAQTLKAPPLLRQPLPSDSTLGPHATLYTHMPLPLARLARWSFECYEVLLDETRAPRHAGAGDLAKRFEPPCAIDLRGKEDCLSYHDQHNPNRKATRGVSLLECWDVQLLADNAIAYSKSVDTISSPADGVHHPQSYAPLLVWRGCHTGGTTGASPFAVKRGALVEAFCDLLPERRLQWAMHQPGEPSTQSTRGNDGPALQDQQPTWLGRLSFLAFCGLRSWPNRQLRAIAASLHDGLLPLEHASTHALLIHALCHVGELRDDGGFGGGGGSRVRMAWKGDLLEGGGAALSVLAEELESAAETLSEQPRAHSAVLVLGRIASILGGLCSEPSLLEAGALAEASARRCLRCARSFSSMAARWADNLEE
jgi:hypothetical protein